jgi:hypothetical protein
MADYIARSDADQARHFHGLVTRFSAGQKALTPDLVDALKAIGNAGARLHVCGFGIPPVDIQSLQILLRCKGLEILVDRLLSASGKSTAIFATSALTPARASAVAQSANQAPAGKRVIDCEGYAYLSML